MDADTPITIDILFGSCEIVPVSEVRDGKLWLGGYSVMRDRDGIETSRTEVSWSCCLFYDGARCDINGRIVPWWKFWA